MNWDNKKNVIARTVLAIIIFILFSANALASPGDGKSPLKLTSNSALCKYQADKTVCSYIGNANLAQEAMQLQSKKITIHKAEDKLDKIVASGENSRYSSNEDEQQHISASADLITIYPEKNTMILKNNGKLEIGKDKYSGPHITYKFD